MMESLFDDIEDIGGEDFQTAESCVDQSSLQTSLTHTDIAESTALSKFVPEEDPLKQYTLFTRYDDSTLRLSMSDGEDTWLGEVTQAELERLASSSHMSREEHLSTTLCALRREDGSGAQFVYSVTRAPSGSLRLSWKKYLSEENIKFQLGEASLHPVSSPRQNHFELCDYAIACIAGLRQQVLRAKAEKLRLIAERASALRRLEESVSLKEDIETDLFGKFKLVLNDKKSKIFELNGQIEQLLDENAQLQQKLRKASTRAGSSGEGGRTQTGTKRGPVRPSEDSGEEEEEEVPVEEDREESGGSGSRATKTASSSQPTSPAQTVNMCSDLLGGGEGEDGGKSSPPVKRQRRTTSRTTTSSSSGSGRAAVSVIMPKLKSRRRTTSSAASKEASSQGSSKNDAPSMESEDLLNML